MKKYLKFLSILPLAAVLILGLSFAKSRSSNEVSPNTNVVKEYKADLKIKLDNQNKDFDISQYVGRTVLEAMGQAGIKIEKNGEGDSAFITSIEGRRVDSKKREFWEFLVNQKAAEVGAGSYKIQNGDQIVWQISNY